MQFAKSPEPSFLHEKFPMGILVCIEKAVKEAAHYVFECHTNARDYSEVVINRLLHERLNDMLQENTFDYFTYDVFQDVVRDASVTSYLLKDGTHKHLEKKPDLTFKLVGSIRSHVRNRTNDGLFVECKLVDTNNSKTVAGYCLSGIARYINGEYAWAMQNAMMIAYSKSVTPSVFPQVEKYLTKNNSLNLSESEMSKNGKCYTSFHDRSWTYFDNSKPGQIEIRHLCFFI